MDKKPRPRGQVIDLGNRCYGIRVPLKERGLSGRRLTHYETLKNVTPHQAEKYKDKLLAKIDAGLFQRAARMTFAALADEWLEQKRRNGIRPASLRTYRNIIDLYLKPHIGKLWLEDLTPTLALGLYNKLQDAGFSDTTIKYARLALNMICRDAVTLRCLPANPVAGVPAPAGKAGRTAYVLNAEEARALLTASMREPEDIVFALWLVTGLRPEEMCGLRRSRVLLRDGRGLVEVREVAMQEKGGWIFLSPKTEKGNRDIPFPAAVYHELQRLYDWTDARRLAFRPEWRDADLVCPDWHGQPVDSKKRTRQFRRLLRRAGLAERYTLYSLRYTYATLQLEAGESDKVVSNQMGHVRVNFTKDVYQHVLKNMQERSSDRLENLLFGAELAQEASARTM